jgi:hypothetical protein
MAGVGGSSGGGLCNRSITDFATSAAERMVSGGSRASDFGARFRRRLGFTAAPAERTSSLDPLNRVPVGLAVGLGFDADRVLDGDLALGAGLALGTAAASSIFRRACFATFLAALNDLRACLRLAFASRTPPSQRQRIAPLLPRRP